jgi:adenylosuccinate synthase
LAVNVEFVEGWNQDVSEVRRIADLPRAARSYIRRIESALGVPIRGVSVGPERSQLAV